MPDQYKVIDDNTIEITRTVVESLDINATINQISDLQSQQAIHQTKIDELQAAIDDLYSKLGQAQTAGAAIKVDIPQQFVTTPPVQEQLVP